MQKRHHSDGSAIDNAVWKSLAEVDLFVLGAELMWIAQSTWTASHWQLSVKNTTSSMSACVCRWSRTAPQTPDDAEDAAVCTLCLPPHDLLKAKFHYASQVADRIADP